MTTFVTDHLSSFLAETDLFLPGDLLLVPTHEDRYALKSLLFARGIDIEKLLFFTESDLREYLAQYFSCAPCFPLQEDIALVLRAVVRQMKQEGHKVVEESVAKSVLSLEVSTGIVLKDMMPRLLSQCVRRVRSEMEKLGYVFKEAFDRSLLPLMTSGPKINKRVLFIGFPPFNSIKFLMEACSKGFRECHVVTQDFGDADLGLSWLSFLETVSGELEFVFSEYAEDFSDECELKTYHDPVVEVQEVVHAIKTLLGQSSDVRIGVCFPGYLAKQLPMLCDGLEDEGISFQNMIGRRQPLRPYQWLIKNWIVWQRHGQGADLGKFCATLLQLGAIDKEVMAGIVEALRRLPNECFSEHYEVMLEYANLKGTSPFEAIEKYHIHAQTCQGSRFYQHFLSLFQDFFPPEVEEQWKNEAQPILSQKVFLKEELLSFIEEKMLHEERDYGDFVRSNVVISSLGFASKHSFSHVFIMGMQSSEYDIVSENFWINDTVLGWLRQRVILEDEYGEKRVCSGKNYAFSDKDRQWWLRFQVAEIIKHSRAFLSCHRLSYSQEAVEQTPAAVFIDRYLERYHCSFRYAQETWCACQWGREIGKMFRFDDLVRSYRIRHGQKDWKEYDWAWDMSSEAPVSCKSLEFLLKNPLVGFYEVTLGTSMMPWQGPLFQEKLAMGSLVHDLLEVSSARFSFQKRISTSQHQEYILSHAKRKCSRLERVYSAIDESMPLMVKNFFQRAEVLAQRLLMGLDAQTKWCLFASEYSLPKTSMVRIGEDCLFLSGRIDFLTSNGDDVKASAVTVIDFKTGNDLELSLKTLKNRLIKFDDIQLFLYGKCLQNLGYRDVSLCILKPDSDSSVPTVSLNDTDELTADVMRCFQDIIKTKHIPHRAIGVSMLPFYRDRVPLVTTDFE